MGRDDHTRRRALSAFSGHGGAAVLAVPRDRRHAATVGVEPQRPRIEAIRVVDMSESNSWAEFAGLFCATRSAFLDHESARSELKALMPEDAKEASGHGIRAKRSKSGAVSSDLLTRDEEDSHAASGQSPRRWRRLKQAHQPG